MKNGKSKDNVIDLTSRIQEPDYRERLRGLKVRFDMEHAKVALSTSLLSIVVLVTLANNNLLNGVTSKNVESPTHASRGIASIPSGSDEMVSENPQLVKELARRDLGPNASVGHAPSALEKLAFGYLEGKYAVRLQAGHLKEIEFTRLDAQDAKRVENLGAFLESQRELLPAYDKMIKVGDNKDGTDNVETFHLVNEVSMPVAKVEFHVDAASRLLSMRIHPVQLASK